MLVCAEVRCRCFEDNMVLVWYGDLDRKRTRKLVLLITVTTGVSDHMLMNRSTSISCVAMSSHMAGEA